MMFDIILSRKFGFLFEDINYTRAHAHIRNHDILQLPMLQV